MSLRRRWPGRLHRVVRRRGYRHTHTEPGLVRPGPGEVCFLGTLTTEPTDSIRLRYGDDSDDQETSLEDELSCADGAGAHHALGLSDADTQPPKT